MKGGEMSKKINIDKSSAKELFITMCKIKNSLRINSVRCEKRKLLPWNLLRLARPEGCYDSKANTATRQVRRASLGIHGPHQTA